MKKKNSVINFVTGNSGKVRTMQKHIGKYGFKIIQKELPLVEPQAKTSEEIALSKAMQAFKILKQPVVVEDSSFHIDELSGFPGPYIKYTLQTLGVKGLLKLSEKLKKRSCSFISVLAYIDSDGVPRTFVHKGDSGILSKKIDRTDSNEAWSDLWRIFIPSGYKKTLSALTKSEKSSLWKKWEAESVFTQFSDWIKENEKKRN